jgi:hypothetical protein
MQKTNRLLLDGVPRVAFYSGGPRPPMDDTFSASLGSCLEFLGVRLDLDSPGRAPDEVAHAVHCRLMGLCGSAFKLAFDVERSLATTSLDAGVTDLNDRIRVAVNGSGFEPEVLSRGEFDKAAAVDQIRGSLKRGIPIVSLGPLGPPEFGVIAGYDSDEDAVIGWSMFQAMPEFCEGVEFESNGMFRLRNWFESLEGLTLLGRPCPVDRREVSLLALQRGLLLLRQDRSYQYATGQAAYAEWTRLLEDDSFWPADSEEELGKSHFYHWQTAGTLAEDRAWGAVFFREEQPVLPEMSAELEEAAYRFGNVHDLVWAIWEFSGPFPSAEVGAPKFADRRRRNRVVPLVRLMAEQDRFAADAIERGLRKMRRS